MSTRIVSGVLVCVFNAWYIVFSSGKCHATEQCVPWCDVHEIACCDETGIVGARWRLGC